MSTFLGDSVLLIVLQDVPAALCHLQLVLLDLTNNSLRRLPPELGLMTSLRSMPLDGNPLRLMRRELWSGDCHAASSAGHALMASSHAMVKDQQAAYVCLLQIMWDGFTVDKNLLSDRQLATNAGLLAGFIECCVTACALRRCTACTGPISALLQHLKSQIPSPDSSKAASVQVGREQEIAAGAMDFTPTAATAGPGPSSRPSGLTQLSGCGRELILQGRGLTGIPAEVWQVRMR
jgi:hypothetical protein